jgi:molybdate transport system substrate-binding protein
MPRLRNFARGGGRVLATEGIGQGGLLAVFPLQVMPEWEPHRVCKEIASIDRIAAARIFVKQGTLVPGSRVNIAKTSLGLSVRADAAKPDISTADSLKKTLLSARAVAASDVGASGIHFMKVLDRLGIAEEMKPKLIIVKGATRTASLVATGEADVAIQMISELLPVAGTQVVGPLPGDLHFEIVLVGALRSDAKEPAAGAELLKHLSSPAAAPALKKTGMQGV